MDAIPCPMQHVESDQLITSHVMGQECSSIFRVYDLSRPTKVSLYCARRSYCSSWYWTLARANIFYCVGHARLVNSAETACHGHSVA